MINGLCETHLFVENLERETRPELGGVLYLEKRGKLN